MKKTILIIGLVLISAFSFSQTIKGFWISKTLSTPEGYTTDSAYIDVTQMFAKKIGVTDTLFSAEVYFDIYKSNSAKLHGNMPIKLLYVSNFLSTTDGLTEITESNFLNASFFMVKNYLIGIEGLDIKEEDINYIYY